MRDPPRRVSPSRGASARFGICVGGSYGIRAQKPAICASHLMTREQCLSRMLRPSPVLGSVTCTTETLPIGHGSVVLLVGDLTCWFLRSTGRCGHRAQCEWRDSRNLCDSRAIQLSEGVISGGERRRTVHRATMDAVIFGFLHDELAFLVRSTSRDVGARSIDIEAARSGLNTALGPW
jgi:hypothetical protein